MLVLSRKRDERIVITTRHGERIEVCLVEMRGDKCRIGIEAAADVTVHRAEVQSAIDRGKSA